MFSSLKVTSNLDQTECVIRQRPSVKVVTLAHCTSGRGPITFKFHLFKFEGVHLQVHTYTQGKLANLKAHMQAKVPGIAPTHGWKVRTYALLALSLPHVQC